MFVYVSGRPETPQGAPEVTQGYAGSVHHFEHTKGMFVYDLVVQFCTDVLVMYENPFLACHDMIDCSE